MKNITLETFIKEYCSVVNKDGTVTNMALSERQMNAVKNFDKGPYLNKVRHMAESISNEHTEVYRKIVNYTMFYHIPDGLAPILTKLHPNYWYLLQVPHTIEKEGERYCDIATGYYTG